MLLFKLPEASFFLLSATKSVHSGVIKGKVKIIILFMAFLKLQLHVPQF